MVAFWAIIRKGRLTLVHTRSLHKFIFPLADSRYAHSGPDLPGKKETVSSSAKPEKVRTESGDAKPVQDDIKLNIDEVILNNVGSENSKNRQDDGSSDDAVRTQILNVALQNVHLYGWTDKAIREAVTSLQLSEASAGMFKRGGADLVMHFIDESNLKLSEHLAVDARRRQTEGRAQKFNVSRFIESAVQTRLRMLIPYINTWPQALAQVATPEMGMELFESGARLIDDIWYFAGDTSTDTTWYTKRGMLAAIYVTTEMFMLNDKSPDYAETWAFLRRRLQDVDACTSAKNSIQNALKDFTSLASGAYTTAMNMMEMGSRRR